MKKLILSLFTLLSMQSMMYAQKSNDDEPEEINEVEIAYEIIDETKYSHKGHRTPPRIPTVYYNHSANKLLFAEPMGECVIELVDTETEDTVFTFPIMNGVTLVQLPLLSTGQYQLKIIRSVYMFSGIIEI